MTAGRLPISLIRYEMLGVEDEVSSFWEFEESSTAE